MRQFILCGKRRYFWLLTGFLLAVFFFVQTIPWNVTASEVPLLLQTEVLHKHTDSCYTDTRCGGTCTEVDYFLEGCDCGVGHTCPDHGCYWEDPNTLYPFGCWHCYCPKSKVWKCTTCGMKNTGPGCGNGALEITCGKSGTTAAVICLERSTGEWCTGLELRVSVDNRDAQLTATPFVWNGVPGDSPVFAVTENGTYTFALQADDNCDTEGAVMEIQVSNIDVTAPRCISYELEPAAGWTKEPVRLTVTEVADLQPDGRIGCGPAPEPISFDGGTWTEERSFLICDSGQYLLCLRDALGNEGETFIRVDHVDITGPEAVLEWDRTDYLSQTVLTVTANDLQKDGSSGCGLAELPYSFNGGQTWTEENCFVVRENGTYTVLVKDLLGNMTEVSAQITNLDRESPEVTVTVSPAEWNGEGKVTISVEAQDTGSGLGETPFSWDGGITFTAESFVEVEEEGTYIVLVRDNNGNITRCEAVVARKQQEIPEYGEEPGWEEENGASEEPEEPQPSDTPAENGGQTGEDSQILDNSDETAAEDEPLPEAEEREEVSRKQRTLESVIGQNRESAENVCEDAEMTDADALMEEDTAGTEDGEEPILVEIEEVKMEDLMMPAEESRIRDLFRENPLEAAAVTVSAALLLMIAGMLLFMLFKGIRVYHQDETGKYRRLGTVLGRHSQDGLWVRLPEKMTEKDASGRFRLCPGKLFVFIHQDEQMRVEAEGLKQLSVRISGKMDFRL